jgi:hypothetical protein
MINYKTATHINTHEFYWRGQVWLVVKNKLKTDEK